MTFINLLYQGRKNIADPYISTDRWETGETRLTPLDHARKLLAHPEFQKMPDKPTKATPPAKGEKTQDELDAERKLQEANLKNKAKDDLEKDEDNQREQMLITIDSMEKPALLEFAAKYPEPVNNRLGEVNLRLAVRNLVEVFGVR